ncbi:hypothetical protein GCM10007916_13860 [Psychromonas marina]|uniref:Uncharacterized protein n=2 Tax=Psychromonas marina TaxID=88364 RepID=A0ABQ6DYU2_9GAMM|nr:hypothetical protein GCM10007916_13860 [Psychromonas marina]
MLATRGNHFETFNQLPSASSAIFFIAGMYLRTIKSFWFFYLLSIVIDLSTSYVRGQLGSCLTVAYPALALSYAAMFAGGFYGRANWLNKSTLLNILQISTALVTASAIAFFISNGSFYLLSGYFIDPSLNEYILRVQKYFFRSVSNPIFYVASVIMIDWVFNRFILPYATKNNVIHSKT